MILNTKYRLYHSDQDGCRHERGSKLFCFRPQYPYRPLGLIIFSPGEAILLSVLIGMQQQLVQPIQADILGPKEFTIGQLELLEKSSRMQEILNSRGVPRLDLVTAGPSTYLTVELSEPVEIVCFWGLEQNI